MADPYFSSVVLLALNDNAANNSTTFVDQSLSAKTLTTVGNAKYSSGSAPTGMTTSGLSDGTGDRVTAADSADWFFSTGDYTIEFWINFTSHTQDHTVPIAQWGTGFGWILYWDNTISKWSWLDGNFLGWNIADTITDGVWTHYAVSRVGANQYFFKNGTQLGATQTARTIPNAAQVLSIMDQTSSPECLNGYIGPVRITKGVGRYSAGFTVPSLPLELGAAAPVADFTGTPLSGAASLSVAFTDSSTNTPTSWLWEKNDGSGWVNFAGSPTAQNPTESFAAGTWSVRLTATNASGSDTKTRTNYITAVAAATGGPGGSGKRYRTHTDWDVQRAKRKALEARVEKLEKKIDRKKKLLLDRDSIKPERLADLSVQLRKMQALMLELLAQLDELNKANEEAEVLDVIAAYYAYKETIH